MRASRIVVTVAAATSGITAALAAADGPVGLYLGCCVATYGTAGIVALVVAANRTDDPDAVAVVEGDSLCDACQQVPPVRIIEVQGAPFAVCSSCTPTDSDPPAAAPFVPTVVR